MKIIMLSILAIILGAGIFQYFRPFPAIQTTDDLPIPAATQAIQLPWPSTGQAAVGAVGYGVLSSNNTSAPVPVASIAKVITAMAVLKQKPIAPGSQGPTLTMDSTDLGFFNYYYLKDGSVAQVSLGEQISEYQALQAMLIPSANNMADSLARWAFGSVDAYVVYANQMVKSMGLTHTTVGDASGFGDNTTSTASDLVKLGLAAEANPVIAQIASQTAAQVPVAGTINNVNFLLGQNGVVGIKTGNTDKAGGCFLFAADRVISGHKVKIVGAVLGQPDLASAISSAPKLLQATDSGFEQVTVVKAGIEVGNYKTPWSDTSPYKTLSDLSLFAWKGQEINISSHPVNIYAPVKSGAAVGTITAQSGQQSAETKLIIEHDMHRPNIIWRLTRSK